MAIWKTSEYPSRQSRLVRNSEEDKMTRTPTGLMAIMSLSSFASMNCARTGQITEPGAVSFVSFSSIDRAGRAASTT